MTRLATIAFFSALSLAFVGCSGPKAVGTKKLVNTEQVAPTEIGEPLFTGEYRPEKLMKAGADPIQVPAANVVVTRKLDLPAKVDGTLVWVGTEITEDEAVKLKPQDVFRHPRDKKYYRRLMPGDQVKRGQIIAMMDDEQAYIEYQGASKKFQAASEEAAAYEKTVTKLAEIVRLTEDGARKGIVPMQEYLNSQATQIRYDADLTNRMGAKMIAQADLDKAKHMLEKHTLRSSIDGEVQQVLRYEGEGIKATESFISLHYFDVLRVEGNLPKEYIDSVRPGDEVTFENPSDVPPKSTFELHTTNKAITALTIGTREGKPLVVSAAEDGWIYAWTADQTVVGSWKMSAAIRALAVTGNTVEVPLLLVGGENGKAAIYDLSTAAKEPLNELKESHDGSVLAAAFSPDGKYCITADDRTIHLWNVSTGERVYKFPSNEHHSPITSLTFTPQGRVVSVGKEPSVRVWQVGDKSANVIHRFDSRTGDVGMLGITDDGSMLLLDADKTRLDVIHLKEGRKTRPLITSGEGVRFQTFAVWSPEIQNKEDNRLIATAGSTEGVVQLWRAPTANDRGREFAKLVCKNYAPATCAAFSPLADQGLIVVGTRKGEVNIWPMPTQGDLAAEIKAKITHVEKAIDSSGRSARVFIDVENPKKDNRYALRPGMSVNLVIRPKN